MNDSLKTCKKCQEEKARTEFYNHPQAKDGLQSWCKPCQIEKARVWNLNNPEYRQAYYQANRESVLASNKAWRDENPGWFRAWNANRRARVFGCTDEFPVDGWDALLRVYGAECMHPDCTETRNLTLDHIQSLSNGGSNTLDNVQVLCSFHNNTKNNKTIDYRDHSKGLLVQVVS